MSQSKFFSNSLIVIGGKESEITTSLANTRNEIQSRFNVPEHTIGTNDLLIFVDGRLLVNLRDYEDINSQEVNLTQAIGIASDFHAILLRNDDETDTTKVVQWEEF